MVLSCISFKIHDVSSGLSSVVRLRRKGTYPSSSVQVVVASAVDIVSRKEAGGSRAVFVIFLEEGGDGRSMVGNDDGMMSFGNDGSS